MGFLVLLDLILQPLMIGLLRFVLGKLTLKNRHFFAYRLYTLLQLVVFLPEQLCLRFRLPERLVYTNQILLGRSVLRSLVFQCLIQGIVLALQHSQLAFELFHSLQPLSRLGN